MQGTNDDVITNADKIESKIKELEAYRNSIIDAAIAKANAIAIYDREYAKTMLKLKNNLIGVWEEINTNNLPSTLIPKVAAGIVWKESLNKEEADSQYKGLITIIEAIRSELNGYQSINRHLE